MNKALLLLSNFRPALFLRPKTEQELLKYLGSYGKEAIILAGGTGIYELAGLGLLSDVKVLIDITLLPFSYFIYDDAGIRIGATTTLSSLQDYKVLQEPDLCCLADALSSIQPLQVKNVATVAGSICTALPFFDLPVALLCLDSSVIVMPSEREVKLEEFIQGYLKVDLSEREYVKEIRIKRNKISGSSFIKHSLTVDDYAIVSCSCSLELSRDRISNIRIFFGGGVGEKPVRAFTIERKVIGTMVDEGRIRDIVCSYLEDDLKPDSDIKASSNYRIEVAKSICRRAIVKASKRVRSSKNG